MASFSLHKMRSAVSDMGSELKKKVTGPIEKHRHMHDDRECTHGVHDTAHRFDSFSPRREGNDIKWYVDGAGYFWAVSVAIEHAKESIWILDWWLSPELYCRRPPANHQKFRLDRLLTRAAERGVKVNIIIYKEVTQALTLSSAYTKHHLEGMHNNIAVFRHPDHTLDAKTISGDIKEAFKNVQMNAASLSKLPGHALSGIYGMGGDIILYWAHHEKLCLIDGEIAFMGGLDLCYGRWDTNQHSISDVHPTNLDGIVFPGQDYNNARIMDFAQVDHWKQNKLDRQTSCRMGWSDVSLCLRGPSVEDLKRHFAQRWNFIYDSKYDTRADERYQRLKIPGIGEAGHHLGKIGQAVENSREEVMDHLKEGESRWAKSRGKKLEGAVPCQIVRSACKWSHGGSHEHSIANAYIDVIKNSEHFIYIENQFFITATSSKQEPVFNRIGAAIVERILRAARAGEKYKIIVVIPAVPAFAGDLRADAALGTRAIMEFQYNGICRGNGESIMECIEREGFDPKEYIRFYNLRNYDRIQSGGKMKKAQEESGISYEEARKHHDDKLGAGYEGEGEGTGATEGQPDVSDEFKKRAAKYGDDGWDSVASCYMLNGEDIRNVPWEEGDVKEIDAFVCEELYVHTKLLIADDRVVICGSANLNDRSQLGTHDSEIAIVVEDSQACESSMDSQPWKAAKFAASLRRQITRKHLGLIPPQDFESPDANFKPIDIAGNKYDWGSKEDKIVEDPLGDEFLALWNGRAKTNTAAFERVFHPVPSDKVKNWKEYDEYYEKFFGQEEDNKDKKKEPRKTYQWGHVVSEEFKDVEEVKEVLSRIQGTLVEMPLLFLAEEDIAHEGLSLNSFTKVVYT